MKGLTPRGVSAIVLGAAFPLLNACSRGRQSVLAPEGPIADKIALFFWIMLAAAVIILAFVMAVLWAGLFRGRLGERPLTDAQSRNLVVAAGVAMPVVVLFAFVVYSADTDRVASGAPPDALTIEVVGHQWWWEIHYLDEQERRIATTANELHIPVGQPVRLLLKATDVIHSFWAPNLAGKMDLIPGKTNTLWFQGDRVGTFRGQCAEFCGQQHAHMAFLIEVQPVQEFRDWLVRVGEPAAVPTEPALERGRDVFLSTSCVMCHAVRGTSALARRAPELTHIGSRKTLAAASLPNSRGHLAGWIVNPQSLKPGSHMPATQLPPEDLSALLDYLESLK